MALASGTRFGSYEVVEQIGAGGMGEVWRATDTQLGRDVAIKVVSQAFLDDADRLARFRREAELLASLNHPNIATIHGLEKADDQTVIVMELVEGPTLADRIREGPISPDEAMGIALQIVAALEAAHAKQIVHRDLKPANVKVRGDGTVKVLDFGISKPIDPAAISGGSPVATTPAMTQTGVILGTAAYMSPEQARGRFVDERTDVWAFGCLLFEMLTGQPAFDGEDVMLTLARVLDRETDLSSMPKTISPAVRHTIRLCLEKDPAKRIADIRDVRLALEGAFDAGGGVALETQPEPRSGARPALAATAGLVVGTLAAGLTVWIATQPADPVVGRFVVPIQDQTIMTSSPSLDFAPSGQSFAYVVGGQRNTGAAELHLRHLGRIEPEVLITDGLVSSPFFSPDESKIGFYENRDNAFLLKYVTIETKEVREVTALEDNLRGASWGADGWIVLAQEVQAAGLWRVHENGGNPERLTTPAEGDVAHFWPEILPGGEAVLFTIIGASEDESEIAVVSLVEANAPVIRLGVSGHFATWAPTGHIVFARDSSLWAVAFDPVSFETGEETSRLEERVLSKNYDDATEFSLSANGDLVFVAAEDLRPPDRPLVWVDTASGNVEPAAADLGVIMDVAMSPDMTRAAVIDETTPGIRIIDLERGTTVPLTGDANVFNPVFSPDSQQIVYATSSNDRPELLLQSADGSGGATSVAPAFDSDIVRVSPSSWPANDTLVLNLLYDDRSVGIGLLDVTDTDSFDERRVPGRSRMGAVISPSGLWLAYMVVDSGMRASGIFIERLSDGRGQQRVSPAGGIYPTWSDDGTTLTYIKLDRGLTAAVRVTVAGESSPDLSLRLGNEQELFPWTFAAPQNFGKFYDMSPGGDRFLAISGNFGEEIETASTIVVLNWLTEMQRIGRLPYVE